MKIEIQEIDFDSSEYNKLLEFRDKHLRRPLGLRVSSTDHLKELQRLSPNRNYPAYVLKAQVGTHGNGVQMFMRGEEQHLQQAISDQLKYGAVLLQQYINQDLIEGVVYKETKKSAHKRIIMSCNGSEWKIMGGVVFSRDGSWVSNSHHNEGFLHKRPLMKSDISERLFLELQAAGKRCGLRQFGADVIGECILELNDGFGISGPLLEEQGIPQKYVQSLNDRLHKHLSKQLTDIFKVSEKKEENGYAAVQTSLLMKHQVVIPAGYL